MRMAVVLLSVLAVLNASGAERQGVRDLGLPEPLRGYRSWTPLLSEPHSIPLSSWTLCASSMGVESSLGPHAKPLVMVFGTPDVAAAMGAVENKPLTLGAVIAKEKRLTRDGPPHGVAFMVKRMTPAVHDTGGWEFLYYPASLEPGEARRTHEHCAACHRAAAGTDYVFGRYGTRDEGGSR